MPPEKKTGFVTRARHTPYSLSASLEKVLCRGDAANAKQTSLEDCPLQLQVARRAAPTPQLTSAAATAYPSPTHASAPSRRRGRPCTTPTAISMCCNAVDEASPPRARTDRMTQTTTCPPSDRSASKWSRPVSTVPHVLRILAFLPAGRRRMKIVKLASSWRASPAVLDHILSISARQKTDEERRSGPRCPRA